MAVATESRRERKKQQTRDQISAAATALFVKRGFEPTTIAEVARASDVAKMTVTNYFPLKEDLVFDRHEAMTGLLAGAVTAREDGVSVLAALRAAYADALTAGDPTLGHIGRPFAQMIESSPALLAREREIFALQERALADVLDAEFARSPADLEPKLAASALAAVFRILYADARRRLLAGDERAAIERALRRAAKDCFDRVRDGLPAALVDPR